MNITKNSVIISRFLEEENDISWEAFEEYNRFYIEHVERGD